MLVEIATLYVGQGLTNIIEVRNLAGNPIFLALFDLGGNANRADDALDYIEDSINNMIRPPGIPAADPYLDAFFISHLDADHRNLINNLRRRYINPITVSTFVIGGAETAAQGNNYMFQFITDGSINPINAYFAFVGYQHPAGNPYVVPVAPANAPTYVNFPIPGTNYTLFLNPLCYQSQAFGLPVIAGAAAAGHAILINTGSIVLLVSVVDTNAAPNVPVFSALLTGDATVYTMQQMNVVGYGFGAERKYMTIPHHASHTTTSGGGGAGYPILANFLTMFHAHMAVASASGRQYRHPYREVMDLFESFLDAPYRAANQFANPPNVPHPPVPAPAALPAFAHINVENNGAAYVNVVRNNWSLSTARNSANAQDGRRVWVNFDTATGIVNQGTVNV